MPRAKKITVAAGQPASKYPRAMVADRTSNQIFFGAATLLFVASATVTVFWGVSMSAMGGMPMPGGWTMEMTWMPGDSWPLAAASFIGMWIVMMVAMMMPCLVPMLSRYRQSVGATEDTRLGRLTILAGTGYFFVWTIFGMLIFPVGAALAALEMQQPVLARLVPIAIGVVVVIAGVVQFTPWKARHLACCRVAPVHGNTPTGNARAAWQHGLSLGIHCIQCCFGLMVILLVIGVMDLRAMAVVAVAITIERTATHGNQFAQATGIVAIIAGLFLITRAAGLT